MPSPDKHEATIPDRGSLASVAASVVPLGGLLIPVNWLMNSFVTG